MDTAAFREMTEGDAWWMARWIARLTEDQLRAALIASGFDAAETSLYAEKLISRRNRMVRDLNLGSEIALIRSGAMDREFGDPALDGAIGTVIPHGECIEAAFFGARIEGGKLHSGHEGKDCLLKRCGNRCRKETVRWNMRRRDRR